MKKETTREQLIASAYHRWQPCLRAYLHKMTDDHTRENVLQEVWRKVSSMADLKTLHLALLKKMAFQQLVDDYRRKLTYAKACERFAASLDLETGGLVVDVQPQELFRSFWEQHPGVRLTHQQKRIVFLVGCGWTYVEIEATTGVPASTVGDWVARARRELKAHSGL